MSPSLLADDLSPYAKAVAAYHERRLDEALRYARDAVGEQPEHVDAYILLGELYYLRQELAEAKAQWERALALAPSRQDVRERLTQLEREAAVERNLARQDTHPFVVRFVEGQAPLELGELRLLFRDTYRLVGQSFDYFPDHPIAVILYPEDQFERVRGLSHQVTGLYDGKIRLPVTARMQESKELQRILWHEYTHAVVHDLSKGRCPLWLNEGLAGLQEARVRPPELAAFRAALQEGQIVPWRQLWQEEMYETQTLKLRYQEAYLVAQYLVRLRGWAQVVSLLKRLSFGAPMEDALKAEYKSDPARLEQEWLAWVRRTYGTG